MEPALDTHGNDGRGVAARRRSAGWALLAAALAGCNAPPAPAAKPALVAPAEFAAWPRATERAVAVGPQLSMLCSLQRVGDPQAERAVRSALGPHAHRSMVVRVSPDGIAAYREGRPLPAGAVVIKEKYDDTSASGPLREYGVMIKHAAGYDPRGGDWEYGFVTLAPTPGSTRGRLAACAGCHASARESDYLFRAHRQAGR